MLHFRQCSVSLFVVFFLFGQIHSLMANCSPFLTTFSTCVRGLFLFVVSKVLQISHEKKGRKKTGHEWVEVVGRLHPSNAIKSAGIHVGRTLLLE